jgi:hypothetical protein
VRHTPRVARIIDDGEMIEKRFRRGFSGKFNSARLMSSGSEPAPLNGIRPVGPAAPGALRLIIPGRSCGNRGVSPIDRFGCIEEYTTALRSGENGSRYLAHRHGDANNTILAAGGYNFSLLIKWLRFLLRLLQALLGAAPKRAAT